MDMSKQTFMMIQRCFDDNNDDKGDEQKAQKIKEQLVKQMASVILRRGVELR